MSHQLIVASKTVRKLALSLAAALGFVSLTALVAHAAEALKVDTVHSSLVFRIKHMNVAYFNGRFDDLSGTISLDEQNPGQSSFDLKVSAGSIDTANAKRDTHLKGPDFFNAKQFPTITFKSTKVAKSADGSYEVAGDMTLHGVTKPMTVKVEQVGSAPGMRGGKVYGFDTTFTFKRSEFGMTNMMPMLGDEVRVTVGIEASK